MNSGTVRLPSSELAMLARPGEKMGEREAGELRYTAFLSYSHKDAAAAGRLHRRLEAYRMPKRLIGRDTPRGPVPERLAPIFRDRDELPAASDLSETVREALARSGALIVLCSPHAAQSLWVAEEIRVFRELHPDRPILAAVLEGDPPDCFPAALRAFGRDGTWHEPLATDLRRDRDGQRLGLLKLVAGITGVGLDALVQRDAARRVRRVMAVTAVALVAMLITTALAVFAFQARREADRQRSEAEGLVEFMLTDLREGLEGVGRLDIMSAVNQRALQYYDRQPPEGGPADLARRARLVQRIGEDELSLGNLPAAEARLRDIYRVTAAQLAGAPNEPNFVFVHAQSEYWLGLIAYTRRDLDAARRAWERYKALAERLVAAEPQNPYWIREVGYAEGDLCLIAPAAVALRTCTAALVRMEQVRRLQGDDPGLLVDLANRHAYLVDLWSTNGRWDRALDHRRQHEALVQKLIRSDPNNLDYRDILVGSEMGFGELLARRGLHVEARQHFRRAADEVAVLRARDAANARWRGLQARIERDMQQERGHGR